MSYSFTVPNWTPARLNQFVGRHWAVGARLKKNDRALVGYYAKLSRIPAATGPRRVSLRFTLEPRRRRWDADSCWKSCLDALTAAGLLVDDGPKWLEMGSVTWARGDRATTITLEDLP